MSETNDVSLIKTSSGLPEKRERIGIYVISLLHADLRRESVKKQLESSSHPWRFVDAVMADSDEVREMLARCELSELWHKPLRPGEIACYLSHRKVWQMMQQERVSHGLILEDDFCLKRSIDDIIAILSKIQTPFGLVKLNGEPKISRVVERVLHDGQEHELRRAFSLTGITVGQWVSAEALPKLIEKTQTIQRPIDMDYKHCWEYPLEIVHIHPLLVDEMSAELGGSMILHRKERKTLRSWLKRWKLKSHFYWNCIRHYGFK
jgi:glycosyl transferase family 25